jgi:hypothetical protein
LGDLSTSYRDAHIALMLVAWNLLPLPIVMLARFFKPIGHVWFVLHRGMAIGVVALSIVALTLAVLHHELGQRIATHFQSAHAIVGIIVVALSIFQYLCYAFRCCYCSKKLVWCTQAIIGHLADICWSADRERGADLSRRRAPMARSTRCDRGRRCARRTA